jgi:hypothetical protein
MATRTPLNYKTQAGLLKALCRVAEGQSNVSTAWWLLNANYALVDKWGWTEADAALFVSRHHPTISVYRASA